MNKELTNSDDKNVCEKASDCVYLLETILGNMKQIEESGVMRKKNATDSFEELAKIYKELELLNSRIIG